MFTFGRRFSRMVRVKFVEDKFYKFYLVLSSIPWPIYLILFELLKWSFFNCFLLHHQVYRLLFTEIYKLSLLFVFCFRLVIFVNQSSWRNIKSLVCNFTDIQVRDSQITLIDIFTAVFHFWRIAERVSCVLAHFLTPHWYFEKFHWNC